MEEGESNINDKTAARRLCGEEMIAREARAPGSPIGKIGKPLPCAIAGTNCLFDLLPESGFCLDLRGKIRTTNAFAAQVLDRTRKDLAGRPFLEVVAAEDRQECNRRLEGCKEDGNPVRWDFRLLKTDGGLIRVSGLAMIAPAVVGDPVLLLTCREVSSSAEEGAGTIPSRATLDELVGACVNSFATLEEACNTCRQEMVADMNHAEERERRRIRGGLHDQVGQGLACARLRLGTLTAKLPEELQFEVEEIRDLLSSTLEITRSLIFQVSNPLLYEVGLAAALKDLGRRLELDHGLRVKLVDEDKVDPLPENVRIVVYQAVNELLFNVVKHAATDLAQVLIRCNGERLTTVVEDDGVGVLKSNGGEVSRPAPGIGLHIIKERIGLLGGALKIDSNEGGGTRVEFSIPLDGRDVASGLEAAR